MTNTNKNFTNAKDIYFRGLGLPKRVDVNISQDNGMNNTNEQYHHPNPNGKYERDARLGLCMKCHYEGTDDLDRRPASRAMPYCELCMIDFSIGTEKLERSSRHGVKKWFGN
jgi:hypothetical protein